MTNSPVSEVIQHLRTAALPRDERRRTDGQLLEDYLGRREDAALAALVARHGPMVWGVCRRVLRHRQDAADAFQATFLVFVRRAASIAAPELLANWLFGVARRTALKARATTARRAAREQQVTELPEPVPLGPDLWSDVQSLLDEELSRLPEKYRVALVLCDLEGKTRKEAAGQLGVPDGTLAARIARGRELLAKRLALRGLTLSAGALAAVMGPNAASAAVPAATLWSTIEAASVFAAGGVGGIPARVVALTEGVLGAMSMFKTKIASAFVLALLVVLGVGASALTQVARDDPKPVTPKEDHLKNTLVALDKSLWDTLGKGDPEVARKLYADDFVGYSQYGRFDKKSSLADVPLYRFRDVKVRDVELLRVNKDTAILTYIYSVTVLTPDGKLDGVRKDHRYSGCWAQRDGGWVLVFHQDFVLPGGK